MKNITLLIVALTINLLSYEIEPISLTLKKAMIKGNSWRSGCPVKVEDLRLLKIPYLGFDGEEHIGKMIVHKDIANEVVKIFKRLKEVGYPIEKIELVSRYGGSDYLSMKNNNTSSFNCRLMTGSKNKWSIHSYGKAIDINPIQNPYVKNGKVIPKKGVLYAGRNRQHLTNNTDMDDRAIIIKGDTILSIFKSYGWIWGGDWNSLKDYQHFEKR